MYWQAIPTRYPVEADSLAKQLGNFEPIIVSVVGSMYILVNIIYLYLSLLSFTE